MRKKKKKKSIWSSIMLGKTKLLEKILVVGNGVGAQVFETIMKSRESLTRVRVDRSSTQGSHSPLAIYLPAPLRRRLTDALVEHRYMDTVGAGEQEKQEKRDPTVELLRGHGVEKLVRASPDSRVYGTIDVPANTCAFDFDQFMRQCKNLAPSSSFSDSFVSSKSTSSSFASRSRLRRLKRVADGTLRASFSPETVRPANYSFVLACDGANSRTASAIQAPAAPLEWPAMTCWSAVVALPDSIDSRVAFDVWGTGVRMQWTPLRGRLAVVRTSVASPYPGERFHSGSRDASDMVEELRPHLAGSRVDATIEAIGEAKSCHVDYPCALKRRRMPPAPALALFGASAFPLAAGSGDIADMLEIEDAIELADAISGGALSDGTDTDKARAIESELHAAIERRAVRYAKFNVALDKSLAKAFARPNNQVAIGWLQIKRSLFQKSFLLKREYRRLYESQ
jgi:hypothetical protein